MQTIRRATFVGAIATLIFGFSATMNAAPKGATPVATLVYVKDMHCATCAKKIAGKLYTVPGVTSVKTNVKKGVALVVPEKSRTPSPKALWEAVEAVKFEPVKIASPLGTFTKKPKR